MRPDFDWQDGLEQLFSAMVNQGTLQEAAEYMASLSRSYPHHHEKYLFLLSKGKDLAARRDDAIIRYINESGYRVSTFEDALGIVSELETEYRKAYDEVTK